MNQLALNVPRPSPSFLSQYAARDGELGEGLGLQYTYAARDGELGEDLGLQYTYAARDGKLGEGSCCYGNGLSTHVCSRQQ